MSVRAKLLRIHESDKQTIGRLSIYSELGSKVYSCFTLELPYRNNEVNNSCIPTGTYTVTKRHSESKGNHLHILDVPGRTWILIHAGNFYFDTKGCILVGDDLTYINKDKYIDITNSRITLDNILGLVPDRFEIEISETSSVTKSRELRSNSQ